MNDIVKRIYELIGESGISKKDLAEKIGVSKNTIQYWKKADSYPSVSAIEKICRVFGITVEQFFCGMSKSKGEKTELAFLDMWRMSGDKEKSSILSVMETFKAIR